MKNQTITKLFFTAGLMNMSVLIFSRFFTNSTIAEYDPVVMSNFGLLMITIWGLAYMAVANKFEHVKWLVAVFVVEKFIYGFIWVKWLINNDITAIYKKDAMAGIFFSTYGINDWCFCIFFLLVFIQLTKSQKLI